jgi:hypothetical protein
MIAALISLGGAAPTVCDPNVTTVEAATAWLPDAVAVRETLDIIDDRPFITTIGCDDLPDEALDTGDFTLDCVLPDGRHVVGTLSIPENGEYRLRWSADLTIRGPEGDVVERIDGAWQSESGPLADSTFDNSDHVDRAFVGVFILDEQAVDGELAWAWSEEDQDVPPYNRAESEVTAVDLAVDGCRWRASWSSTLNDRPLDGEAGQTDPSLQHADVIDVAVGDHAVHSERATVSCPGVSESVTTGFTTVDGVWVGPWSWVEPTPPDPFVDADEDGLHAGIDADDTVAGEACGQYAPIAPTIPTGDDDDDDDDAPAAADAGGCGCHTGGGGALGFALGLLGALRRKAGRRSGVTSRSTATSP